jgi:pimeloyl-ACP methyl ester carboxylesterase
LETLNFNGGSIADIRDEIDHFARMSDDLAALVDHQNRSRERAGVVRPEVLDLIRQSTGAVPAADRNTSGGQRELKVTGATLAEPNIEAKALEAITAPILILASDHDTIVAPPRSIARSSGSTERRS